ncbi:MAG: ABC transporter ATP-binding protein [Phycisphaerales bacterium]|nr:ABC transporter ATP-binding protein [Phycisphaerales bacterium]
MSTAISIRSLLKAFKGPSGTTRAVDSVSLEISPGELFFLLGPSGCGKTTLLRMVAGFIDPDDGQILLAPRPAASAANPPAPEAFRDVTHLAPNKRNTGMVFQSYALWPHMTVGLLELTDRLYAGRDFPPPEPRTAEALELVQMAHLAKRRPNQLSGGQQQRVALARALVIRPDVLLLDEPLSNLDAKLRLELRAEIRRVCKEAGLTTIYVTHDQKEALSMADRVAIMRDGKVVQTGTPADLYRRPAERFVAEFLGETNIIEADAAPAGAMIELKFAKTTLRADSRDGTPTTGPVLLSIRPEAIALRRPTLAGVDLGAANGAALTAEITETTYLGEIAQHRLKLADGTILRAAELNPAPRSAAVPSKGGARVTLSIQPHDIVVLPRA